MTPFETELKQAFADAEPTVSMLQREVAAALERVGWAHEFEHRTAEGVSLDMAQPESKAAVECDGPWHFLTDARGRASDPNGAALFKKRVLRTLGWRVWHLPYIEWNRLQSHRAQEEYLKSGLADLRQHADSLSDPSLTTTVRSAKSDASNATEENREGTCKPEKDGDDDGWQPAPSRNRRAK